MASLRFPGITGAYLRFGAVLSLRIGKMIIASWRYLKVDSLTQIYVLRPLCKWYLHEMVLISIIWPLIFLIMLPRFVYRMVKRGGYGLHFTVIRDLQSTLKQRARACSPIWVHAVSVGEMYVAIKMVNALRESGYEGSFLFSTTTSTGFKIAEKEFDLAADMLIYFSIDFPGVAQRVLSFFA